jgi:hypothetical protein
MLILCSYYRAYNSQPRRRPFSRFFGCGSSSSSFSIVECGVLKDGRSVKNKSHGNGATWHLLRAAGYDVSALEKTPPPRALPWAHLCRPSRLRSQSSFFVYDVAIHLLGQQPRQQAGLYRSQVCPSPRGSRGIYYHWFGDAFRNRSCAIALYIRPWDTRNHA